MTVSGNVDFNALSESEQRAVAERLIKLRESDWRPFWCPNTTCNGDPHPLPTDDGSLTYVSGSDEVGPNGEPIGWKMRDGRITNDPKYRAIGKPVLLDPQWAHNHAREDQRLPAWNKPWTLFVMSGRGSGKTTLGVEFVTLCARRGLDGAILGRRGTELVNTHVATLIARAHPDFMPVHYASKDIVVWPNGAITYLFSAEKPENIRSVNLSYTWTDEAAFMDEIKTAWMNLKLATRVRKPGNPIHHLITSTPTPTEWTMQMEDDSKDPSTGVTVRRVSTYANRANLDDDFINDLEREYEGTRMGRQELHGEVLRDVVGALWNDDIIKHQRVKAKDFPDFLDALDIRVVAIDPAGSANKRSDETGIVGVGGQHFDEDGERLRAPLTFVLGDATLKGTPTEWAAQAYKMARLIDAHYIVAEKNFGGEMVKEVLENYAKLHPEEAKNSQGETFTIKVVHAAKSKETRAEGLVNRYEQGRVTHVVTKTVFGDLSMMEKEQVNWVPRSRGGKSASPNRIDALVWGGREVDSAVKHESQASDREAVKMVRQPVRAYA